MIPDIKASAETTMEKVWFVDVVTHCGPGCEHSVPVHVALEQCAEILNAKYIAVVDQNCPLFRGTEKWLRVIHNPRNPTLHDIAQLAKQRQYYPAVAEIKTKLSALCELWIRTRSLLKDINNKATCIVIYLDFANPVQILAVWLSVVCLVATRNKTIVWTHFDRISGWQGTKIGRFVRYLFNIFPIKVWTTAYTSEIAAESRKYGWIVDILPLPLNPALNAFACNHKSTNEMNVFCEKFDQLVCWLFITRLEQGLELLPRMIDHRSARNFPKKFIKCFVSEKARIKENAEIELVSLPYLSEEDYRLHFSECEVVLLPYNAHSFAGSPSMVFVEAIATCKIPIVSDRTVMARELRKFELGDLVMDFDNEFSWAVINDIRKDISIRARLKLMAESYIREHDTFACAQSLYKSLKQINSKIALSEPKRT